MNFQEKGRKGRGPTHGLVARPRFKYLRIHFLESQGKNFSNNIVLKLIENTKLIEQADLVYTIR